jgi:hypothetical protein
VSSVFTHDKCQRRSKLIIEQGPSYYHVINVESDHRTIRAVSPELCHLVHIQMNSLMGVSWYVICIVDRELGLQIENDAIHIPSTFIKINSLQL